MVEKEVPVKKVESQKINSRYRLAKIDGKFYIIDYTSAKKIWTFIFPLKSYKHNWRATEITREEVRNEFHGFHPKKKPNSPLLIVIFALLGQRFLFPDVNSYPKIAPSFSARIILLLSIPFIVGIAILVIQKIQSKQDFVFDKEINIERKMATPFMEMGFLLIHLLFIYGLIYAIFCKEKINIIILVVFSCWILWTVFIRFFDTPISTKYFIYTLKNNE